MEAKFCFEQVYWVEAQGQQYMHGGWRERG